MSTLKIYMEPKAENCSDGIRRVIDAQRKYLPDYGVHFTNNINEADLTVGHGTLAPVSKSVPYINHNHGAYWREYEWGAWADTTNRQLADAIAMSDAYTVPSEWVGRALSRGFLKKPTVIYHGVEPSEYVVSDNPSNYILWNKARTDSVSNSEDMNVIAELCPDLPFVSTLGRPAPNVTLIGVQPVEQMRMTVSRAGVYLATARETFGIGTLEALAYGVPVVGWDYGGQREIVVQGETGYLAPYGDYGALSDCLRRALGERKRLSANAVANVLGRWGWGERISQYAVLYRTVAESYHQPRPKVSVIIPCHNLAAFLPDAVESVLAQTMTDWECIIVNDASTDETGEVAWKYVTQNNKIRYFETPSNLKLSGTRNYGFDRANGKYIKYLDADDILTPNALALESAALDADKSIHIAYGSLDLISEDGTGRRRNRFPQAFNWFGQMAHLNQIPTGAMMRREVIETSGGWRERMWRAEDAEFWARVTSFGYRAKKVTEETTLLYRLRQDSKGSVEHRTYADNDGNWLEHIAWRSADTAQQGTDWTRQFPDTLPHPELVPFGAQGQAKKMWSVSHREEPLISVGLDKLENKTDQMVYNTMDSLDGQTTDEWEVAAEPWARGKIKTTVEVGEILASNALRNLLMASENPKVTAYLAKPKKPETSLVQLRYKGTQADHTFRVNGRTYKAVKGGSLFVNPDDVERLLRQNLVERV